MNIRHILFIFILIINLSNIAYSQDQQVSKPKTGIVFGKADFRGLLETGYVKLFLQRIDEGLREYNLYIGRKPSQEEKFYIKDKQDVEPIYFFMQLPEGEYLISNIGVPVGSKEAQEDAHLSFHVKANKGVYLGTLRFEDLKERVKFGGVPLVKPGFEYDVKISNEFDEAVDVFMKRYPGLNVVIETQLFRIMHFPK